TAKYPVPCSCHELVHCPSTQRICSRSVSGSVRSAAKARGSACRANSSSRSVERTGARWSRGGHTGETADRRTARRSPSKNGIAAPCTGCCVLRAPGRSSGVAAVGAALLVVARGGLVRIGVDLDLLGLRVRGAVAALQRLGHVPGIGGADGVGDGG